MYVPSSCSVIQIGQDPFRCLTWRRSLPSNSNVAFPSYPSILCKSICQDKIISNRFNRDATQWPPLKAIHQPCDDDHMITGQETCTRFLPHPKVVDYMMNIEQRLHGSKKQKPAENAGLSFPKVARAHRSPHTLVTHLVGDYHCIGKMIIDTQHSVLIIFCSLGSIPAWFIL